MKINDKNGLLEELDQTANGPEIDQNAGELDNEATIEKEPETKAPTTDNGDAYGSDDQTTEDVEEVVVTEGMSDYELYQALEKAGYKTTPENLSILKEELNQLANGPELDQKGGELKNEATEEGEGDTEAPTADNGDSYGDDDQTTEDVEEVVVTEGMSDYELYQALEKAGWEPCQENLDILKEELNQLANGPELDQKGGELKNEATDGEAEEKSGDADNGDVYGDDDKTEEDVKEVKIAEGCCGGKAKKKGLNEEDLTEPSPEIDLDDADQPVDPAPQGTRAIDNADTVTPIEDQIEQEVNDAIDNPITSLTEKLRALREELDQNANGPEIDQKEGELDNEATLEKEPETKAPSTDNGDSYGDDDQTTEDVEEVVVTEGMSDYELYQLLESCGYETTPENINILREGAKWNKAKGALKKVAGGVVGASLIGLPIAGQANKQIKNAKDNRNQAQVELANKQSAKKSADSKVSSANVSYNSANDTLTNAKSAYDTKKGSYDTASKAAKDAYNDYEYKTAAAERSKKQAESLASIGAAPSSDKKAAKDAAEYADFNAKLARATKDSASESAAKAKAELDDASKKYESAKSSANTAKAALDSANKSADEATKAEADADENLKQKKSDLGSAKIGGTAATSAGIAGGAIAGAAIAGKIKKKKKDDSSSTESKTTVTESLDQNANGPEITQAAGELTDEATLKKEPTTAAPTEGNGDIYCDYTHKQVEDVVEVVIEAANICKENGVPSTIANLAECVRQLLEADGVAIDCAEKEANPNAFVASQRDPELEYDEAVKKDIETREKSQPGLNETVKYTSLKEACMLDEGYFNTDSYTIQKAEDKKNKLLEQVALLIARDNNDPQYNDLLKESIHCSRLQESIVNKYRDEAAEKVNQITE